MPLPPSVPARFAQLIEPDAARTAAWQLLPARGDRRMHILQRHTGELVRVRRARWQVVDVRSYDGCDLLTLEGRGPANAGLTRHVLAPFDAVERIARRRRPRLVAPLVWRRACRGLLAHDAPPGALQGARRAHMDLLPYQLEPALALIRGLGSRVLLADDVGLGKTVQAGLIVAELRARGCADRVLILTPPALREQWLLELARRFGVDASAVDVAYLRRVTSTLPLGANPWTATPVSVSSIDYVKRPEVLPAVLSCPWDVVIVDEAHGAAGDSDRHAAVSALTARAGYVVLATATPHSGDREAFSSLCSAGSVNGDSLLVFRRTRADVGLDSVRHIHRLNVRPSAAESRMHALMGLFSREVRTERGDGALLALSVLHKRALSSAHSLERSVARRLEALSAPGEDGLQQLALPMGDPSGEMSTEDEAPGWPVGLTLRDVRRERRLLQAIAESAAAASRRETKISALNRLLGRIDESVIVFTEYRDTLLHLAARLDRSAVTLHGGLSRDERLLSLARFSRGGRIALLATDAAGQGLNLHHRCRVVINLELPWNPMRLEQRIGRVDRIGQRRTVHAFHLIARGTGESLILDRLKARVALARADIRVPDPLGADTEEAVARLIVDGIDRADDVESQPPEPPIDHERIEPSLSNEAAAEAARLGRAREIAGVEHDSAIATVESQGPAMLRPRHWRTRARLGSRLILVWRLNCEDGCGRVLGSTIVPISVECGSCRLDVDAVLEQYDEDLRRQVDAATTDWRRGTDRFHQAFTATRLERERGIFRRHHGREGDLFQGGLFDRRGQMVHIAAVDGSSKEDAERLRRLADIERRIPVNVPPAELILLLRP